MSMVDRDLVAEERAARQAAGYGAARRSGMDAGTRRLALIAGGIGGLLVAMVGGWSLLGHRPAGIPLIAPLPGPVRVKPADPGGMQLMAGQVAQTNGPAAQALAPGPEAPAPEALQAEVDAARKADAPPAPPPAASSVPAAATQAPATAVPAATVSTAPVDTVSRPLVAVPPAAVGDDSPDVAPEIAPGVASTPSTAPAVGAAPDAAPAEAAPPAVAGGHAVQLAALDSEAAAHAEWSKLARQAPSLFGDRAPVIVHISRNGRQFYRLRTGGFASVADATAFCGRARALGIACTLADF